MPHMLAFRAGWCQPYQRQHHRYGCLIDLDGCESIHNKVPSLEPGLWLSLINESCFRRCVEKLRDPSHSANTAQLVDSGT